MNLLFKNNWAADTIWDLTFCHQPLVKTGEANSMTRVRSLNFLPLHALDSSLLADQFLLENEWKWSQYNKNAFQQEWSPPPPMPDPSTSPLGVDLETPPQPDPSTPPQCEGLETPTVDRQTRVKHNLRKLRLRAVITRSSRPVTSSVLLHQIPTRIHL